MRYFDDYPVGGLSRQPIPGVPIYPPLRPARPGDVLLGYQMYQPTAHICRFDELSLAGWICIIILLFVFFPIAWLPCVVDDCYTPYQRPVYGRPGEFGTAPQQEAHAAAQQQGTYPTQSMSGTYAGPGVQMGWSPTPGYQQGVPVASPHVPTAPKAPTVP